MGSDRVRDKIETVRRARGTGSNKEGIVQAKHRVRGRDTRKQSREPRRYPRARNQQHHGRRGHPIRAHHPRPLLTKARNPPSSLQTYLKIPMANAVLVQVRNALGDLAHHLRRLLLRKGTRFSNLVKQLPARQQLEDDKELRRRVENVPCLNHVGVKHLAAHLHLPSDVLHLLRRKLRLLDDLDSHVLARLAVRSQPYLRKRTLPEHPPQLVVRVHGPATRDGHLHGPYPARLVGFVRSKQGDALLGQRQHYLILSGPSPHRRLRHVHRPRGGAILVAVIREGAPLEHHVPLVQVVQRLPLLAEPAAGLGDGVGALLMAHRPFVRRHGWGARIRPAAHGAARRREGAVSRGKQRRGKKRAAAGSSSGRYQYPQETSRQRRVLAGVGRAGRRAGARRDKRRGAATAHNLRVTSSDSRGGGGGGGRGEPASRVARKAPRKMPTRHPRARPWGPAVSPAVEWGGVSRRVPARGQSTQNPGGQFPPRWGAVGPKARPRRSAHTVHTGRPLPASEPLRTPPTPRKKRKAQTQREDAAAITPPSSLLPHPKPMSLWGG